jgi:hypothetical protein
MNTPTPTPTPRTDAATYPADCLGTTLVTNRDCARALERELAALTAERDQLRAEVERLTPYVSKAILTKTGTMLCSPQVGVAFNEMRARAERAEAELATERDKAERYRLAMLKLDAQLADWSVLKGWGGTPEIIHQFVKGQQNRIHHCQDIDAELAAERARLDWVFRNCKVTADDYTTGNRDVYAIHDREDLGAAMKEDA